ncbi:3'(2'),5'-bisphosphate nucleotidase CysQ [Mesobacterium pallidum]|uniref:3'(2'),5'-bisphosphate nucleotidase CysQ n=1 Tax=Mesobacterium pallidum TaxID=2872037 RepID=UPI001EE211CC|nr:3'(2'),5'-bisphosphate nucleotidase CysQ [Mesobacterium pallidum]
MPETDLELLIRAARAAGQTVRDLLGQPLEIEEKDDGAGPVTQADLAANATLERVLRGARPDYGWLSEESPPDSERLSAPATFVVDPIDGTRSFIQGDTTWAHSLAVVRDGKPVAAAVYLPMRDRMFSAALGQGADLNGAALVPSVAHNPDGARVLAAKPALAAEHWKGAPPELYRHYRPSLAYRLCLVAEGRFDAMLTLRPSWEWDIAAGTLICQEAGARVTDRTGAPLRFNNADPRTRGILAAAPGLHGPLLARLGPA